MSTPIHIVSLKYSISFNDADYGPSYAGDGCKLISIHEVKSEADALVVEFNPIFALAEKNSTICPKQESDRKLDEQFGFNVHDIDNGYDFKLVVETYTIG